MTSLDIDSTLAAARKPFGGDMKTVPAAQVHVDIPAILGGAAVATGIAYVMTSFGAGIGLASTPANAPVGFSAVALSVATGLWILWIVVSSFAAGGYITARMRRLTFDSSEHERDIRDGAHGVMVWAVGLIALAWLAAPALSGLAKVSTAAVATSAAARLVDEGNTHVIDRLERGAPSSQPASNSSFHDDLNRSLTLAAAKGSIAPEDKTYLSQQIATREGISPADADKKIDDAVNQLKAAADKAREVADSARRAGVILAFLTGASLLIGAATAWWAASMGGRHRDQQADMSHLTNWR